MHFIYFPPIILDQSAHNKTNYVVVCGTAIDTMFVYCHFLI